MPRIHLDTDLGSDTDDLCALAFLIAQPDVELTGVTTCTDPGGRRAGLTRYALALAGRVGPPVVAGAEGSLGGLRWPLGIPVDARYWPEKIDACPSRPGEALELLLASAERGATLVAIGPWTNLALLEAARPGTLASSDVVVMGGMLRPPRDGLPQWGPEQDYNVQQDAIAAKIVLERAHPLVADIAVTLEVTIRRADLPSLEGGGPLARLLASQACAHTEDNDMAALVRSHAAVPDDALNFQYDVVAAAAAIGWPGIEVEERRISTLLEDGLLRLHDDPLGNVVRLVSSVDAERLRSDWLEAVSGL
jgi:inosine-uridine nucleoside N-ribohydrolase